MASYLLLRDNKESGPYTLNDLVSLGLKPYDLVWVESRSAAWRYPSEIPELKEYAPIVEEQPYDRFFKKQQAETVEQILEKRLNIEKDKIEKEKKNTQQEPVPFIESQKPAWPVVAKGFAGGQGGEEKQPVKPKVKQKEEEENPYQAYQPRPNVFVSKPLSASSSNNSRSENQVEKQAASYSAYSAASQEPVLERKYSQSLDEIKEMYVNTLVQRKSKNRRKELMKKYLKPALVSISLVLAGIIIGYFIMSRDATIQASQGISTVVPSQNQEALHPKNQVLQPDENQSALAQADKKDPKLLNQQLLVQQKLQAKNRLPQQTTNGVVSTVTTAATQTQADNQTKIEKQDVEVDPQTNERNRVVRSDEDSNTEQPKENKTSISDNDTKDLKKLVSVNANDYLRGVFGGIRDLKITVNNRSKYVLDAVTVKVEYMKVTNQPLKTETITFKNVNPNDAETIKLPDSQRGMRVTYHITNIESKQFQKNTAGL
jgi:hypothetical protein